ncbi:MAG: cation:proton antiporter [Acidobacteria bacterium]|nr:cation:proton antiporter [Acidobacteriota bacterium]
MEHNMTHIVMVYAIQIGLILIIAKIVGEFTEKVLKQPSVLGELIAGMIIGPYALGAYIKLPVVGALFELPHHIVSNIPVSTELYTFAQIAAVILLFVAGLETNLKTFLKYAGPATIIAIGGVIFPFAAGYYGARFMGVESTGAALFMGAIMTATSVGITARVLSDIQKLDTPEGVTILGGAVVDDVLGILVLAIVVNLAETGNFDFGTIGAVTFKAAGFYVAFTALAIIFSKHIAKFISLFRSPGASISVAVGISFVCAAIFEMFGLAMIIGAYSIGLALSNTKIAHELEEKIQGLYSATVPVFFVIMGMLVDFRAMKTALVFGLVISVLAIITKVLGCGIPAKFVGFNTRGAWRVGVGMLPRGEVALIVAGIGLSRGVIGAELFGVSIMMTMLTTLLAPIFLVPAFEHGGSGQHEKHHKAEKK